MGLYVGMDLHSNNCYTAIVDEKENKLFARKLPNDKRSILSALKPYQKDIVGIAVESTYNWYWLVDGLMEEGYPMHLANPSAMKQYKGLKHVDDRHDAFWIARMLRLGILPQGYIYPRQTRGLRDLLRQRSRFVVQKTSLKHTLQQIFCNHTGTSLSNNVIAQIDAHKLQEVFGKTDVFYNNESLLRSIRFLEQEIETIEKHVLSKVDETANYRALCTVPGIGVVLGLTITLETGPWERFASASHFASYCRCVPSAYWSNAKQKGAGNKKNGNKYLSWAFAEASNFAIRYCEEAKAFYQRKGAKTKAPIAYRAVANKLAKACYYLMRDESVFDAKRLFYK